MAKESKQESKGLNAIEKEIIKEAKKIEKTETSSCYKLVQITKELISIEKGK